MNELCTVELSFLLINYAKQIHCMCTVQRLSARRHATADVTYGLQLSTSELLTVFTFASGQIGLRIN